MQARFAQIPEKDFTHVVGTPFDLAVTYYRPEPGKRKENILSYGSLSLSNQSKKIDINFFHSPNIESFFRLYRLRLILTKTFITTIVRSFFSCTIKHED